MFFFILDFVFSCKEVVKNLHCLLPYPRESKKKEKENETQGKKNKKDDDLNPSP